MIADIHLHSSFSFDSDENIDNYIVKAKSLGEKVLGFTEHYDYDAYLLGEDLGLLDIESYLPKIESLRQNNPDMKILAGIELGYSVLSVDKYKEIIKKYPFDHVVLSVHCLPVYGDFYNGTAFVGRNTRDVYEEYLQTILASINSDVDYDIIAHIGYCQRYAKDKSVKIDYDTYPKLIDEILTGIIKKGKCLEINTSFEGVGDFLPDKSIIRRYISLGGKSLSFASDAHKADRYTEGKDAVISFLKSIGVEEMSYFSQRKEIRYKI